MSWVAKPSRVFLLVFFNNIHADHDGPFPTISASPFYNFGLCRFNKYIYVSPRLRLIMILWSSLSRLTYRYDIASWAYLLVSCRRETLPVLSLKTPHSTSLMAERASNISNPLEPNVRPPVIFAVLFLVTSCDYDAKILFTYVHVPWPSRT